MDYKKIENSAGIVNQPIDTKENNSKQEIIREATKRAIEGYDYHRNNMDRAERALSFIFGEQYTEEELQDKEMSNRITMTFNKLPQFINKVVGSQRKTAYTIDVSPTGNNIEDKMLITANGEEKKEAEVIKDIVRDIEYNSNAKSWYKMAFKHALEGGFGWLRVLTQYQDDGFDLDIKIAGVRDRWSVIPDPDALEEDMSDMNWCFITERMTVKEFQKRYPGKSYEPIVQERNSDYYTFWRDEDTVTVAEYFRREPIKKTIVEMSDGRIYDKDDVDEVVDELREMGITQVREREIDSYKVVWCKISQQDILEGEIEFPTTTIPVVPVLGRSFDFRGKRLFKGLIEDAIDSQKALNKMRSSALERIDSSPLSPFVATDKSIEGYEQMWAEANQVKYSTLVYRKGEERPTRELGATIPTAELQTTQVLDEDIKSIIGIYNASLGQTSNEVSGRAIEARKAEADTGTYEFMDNYENAIRRIGILVTELIPKIYDTNRVVRLRGVDGSTDKLELNKVITDDETGKKFVINSIGKNKHTVIIQAGASYETKQEQNSAQILELMRVNQNVAQVGSDLLVRNLDFADSDILADRLTRTIPMQYLPKEQQEAIQKDMPPPQPTPEQQLMQGELQLKQQEAEFKQQELQLKLQMEQIKLQQAQINLETKKVEAGLKIQNETQKIQQSDEKRKDEIAKSIADKIRNKGN